jgi:NTE family protein
LLKAMQNHPTALADMSIALVLSGGNALAAYQAGAYQALQERGLEPDWVVGASAGAINGAVICGNPPERRIEKLAALWHTSGTAGAAVTPPSAAETARRTQVASMTIATGQLDWFVPRALYGPWWNPFGNREPNSLYDSSPLVQRLNELVDFDRLNSGTPRFSATAVDVESGADVIFDTAHHRITPQHVRGSGALLPAFPPVEVEGRMVGDAGLSANLPVDAVLSARLERPLLCIAVDLLPLTAPRPRRLGDTLSRTQELLFAVQSRRAMAAWQAIYAERARRGDWNAVTLLHVAYSDQAHEVSGKAFDFSPISAEARWQCGYRDLKRALASIEDVVSSQPGLHVHVPNADGGLKRVEWPLAPQVG